MIHGKVITRDSYRAKRASAFIHKIRDDSEAFKIKDDIKKEIEALPARIRINGLLQTLVFLMDKADEKKDRTRLGMEMIVYLSGRSGISDPADAAVDICSNRLAEATEEAFAFSNWLKLMAKAQL
ncbi:MAG: type III-B CRISPR module-associated protein Cmr5 [Desulfobacterales bacterium]|nr:type III-B CRISPR module-associated protein Cmr5 [Desulfobacterales bacterium]